MKAYKNKASSMVVYSLLLGASLWGAACTDEETTASVIIIDTDDMTVDGMTAATPGSAAAKLTSSHQGFERSDCKACHQNIHASGFTQGQCAFCHGGNGAPTRPAPHDNGDCSSCHVDAHANSGFASPGDCRFCHVYAPSTECTHEASYDAVVIGAGGGGLGAAAYLATQGRKVLVVEQSMSVGGAMKVLSRRDYRIEASLFAHDGMGSEWLEQTADLPLGQELELTKFDPYAFRAVFPEHDVKIPAAVEDYEDELQKLFPDQATAIASLFVELMNFGSALGYLSTPTSFGEVLAKHGVTDPQLIAFLTRFASSFGTAPDKIPAGIYMILWYAQHVRGFFYPVGGSQAVADALARIVERGGGEIELGAKATRIEVKDGLATMVRTDDGGCYAAKYVLSNANFKDTFLNMIDRDALPAAFVSEVEAMKPGLSGFHIYLGVDADYSDVFAGTPGIALSASYDPMENFTAMQACDGSASEFIIVNYTVADPTSAPPGKNVIALNAQLPYECFDNWKWTESYRSYNEAKHKAAMAFVERAEQFLPGLSNHIEVFEVTTPRTIELFTSNPGGTIFGQARGAGEFTLPTDVERIKTPIPNLLVVGAWPSGGGQWVVIQNGVAAGKLVLEMEAGR